MPLYRIEIECDNEGELETILADGRWSAEVVETINSKFIQTVSVTDPDSGGQVEIEIRKLDNGAMIGFDGSWLEQFDVNPNSPYETAMVAIPDNEN